MSIQSVQQFTGHDRLHWYHWTVVVLSLILTISAWYITSQNASQKSAVQFNFQAQQIVKLVRERMEKYEQALWSGAAAIHSQPDGIEYKKWQRFSEALSIEERYPGINGVGVIYHVPKDNLASFVATQKAARPDFKIHPTHQQQEYWPITYIEPVEINKKAVGLDMAHEFNRFTAAKKSRDTGTAQITGPIILVQDAKKTPGFLFFVPFYQEIHPPVTLEQKQQSFTGIVYAPFIMNKLMLGTLQNKNRLVNFTINDGEQLLYDELHVGSEDYDQSPLFAKTIDIEMYGRHWVFSLQSSNIFRQQQSNSQPLMILIGGITIDLMLLTLFIVLTRSNKKAVELANRMTVEYKASEERLTTTMDNMNDGLLTVNQQNQIIGFNRTLLNIFGFSNSDVQGKTTGIFVNLENEPLLDATNTDLSKKHHVVNLKNKDGQLITVEISVSKTIDTDVPYFVVIMRDLSLKIETEHELLVTQAILQAAIQSSTTAFAIVDRAGKFMEINQALYRWLSYDKLTLVGKNCSMIVPPDEKSAFDELFERLISGDQESIRLERQFLNRDKSLIWGVFTASPVLDKSDNVAYLVIQIVDIQKEKELLENLKFQNVALEKSNKDLEQFAYLASHDLKSPLNAIHQLASWLEEDCQDILPDESKEHLQLMIGRSKRMKQLLEDLLDYSRVNRFAYTNEQVCLSELVDDQFKLLGNDEFSCESDDSVITVPRTPLEIIIRNLLSNAIKHHHESHGHIEVRVSMTKTHYTISVKDDGPGIPVNMHDRVQEMFQTLKPRDAVEGSGMGLAIVKRIAGHYQGCITIISDGKNGTSVDVSWPITKTSIHDVAIKQQI